MILARLSFVHRAPVLGKWMSFWYGLPDEYSPIVGLITIEQKSIQYYTDFK